MPDSSTRINKHSRDSLPRECISGLMQTRMILDQRINSDKPSRQGFGNLVYLTDATYLPFGEPCPHTSKGIDVITIILEGRLAKEGSQCHNYPMPSNHARVQRSIQVDNAADFNPDLYSMRLLQLWALPNDVGVFDELKHYPQIGNQLQRVYGGATQQSTTFDNRTIIEFGVLNRGKSIYQSGKFMAYICNGSAMLNGEVVHDGDLVFGEELDFNVISNNVQLTLATHIQL